MAVTVITKVKAEQGMATIWVSAFKEILPDTRVYEANISIELIQNQDDLSVLLPIEQWKTRAQYENYLTWRTEIGTLPKIVEQIHAPPNIRYFNPTDS